MANKTKLSQEEMRVILERIRVLQERYDSSMKSLSKVINVDMEAGWSGLAASSYKNIFNGFSKSFITKFGNLLNTYGLVLNDTAREIGYDDHEIANQIRSKLG